MENKYTIKMSVKTYTIGVKEPTERLSKTALRDPDQFAEFARAYLKTLDADREHFIVGYMNGKLELIAVKTMFSGTIDETPVYPRDIARDALLLGSSAVILCHNHPSGKLQPSPEDMRVTKRIKEALELIGTRVLDHIIVTDEGFFSFCSRGILSA